MTSEGSWRRVRPIALDHRRRRIDVSPRGGQNAPMIRGIIVLLVCQLGGEVIARSLALPAPGPVIGLAVLTLGLWLANRARPFTDKEFEASDVGRASLGLLAILSLLFVPAGVGVVQYLGLLGEHGLALAAALVVSTALTLVVTVGVFVAVKRWLQRAEG